MSRLTLYLHGIIVNYLVQNYSYVYKICPVPKWILDRSLSDADQPDLYYED